MPIDRRLQRRGCNAGVGTVKSPSKRRRGGHAVVVGRPPKRQRALTEALKSPIKARCLTFQTALLTSRRFSSCIGGSAKNKSKVRDGTPSTFCQASLRFHATFASCRVAVGRMTMSQVDPAVFAELPPDVAAELALALPPSHAAFFSEGNIPPDPGSPSPVGAEIGAAAQSDARAKAPAKVIPAVLKFLTARTLLLH